MLNMMLLQSQVFTPYNPGFPDFKSEHNQSHTFPLTQNGVVVIPYQRMAHQTKGSDGKLRLDSMVMELYNPDINTLCNYWKYAYEYTASGQNSSMIFFEWDLKKWDWAPNNKMVFAYNPEGLPEEISYYRYYPDFWDPYTYPWMPEGKSTYLYNQNDQLIESINYSWNLAQMQWRPWSQMVIDLDSADKRLEVEVFTRDHLLSQWKEGWLDTYSYNTAGLLAEIIYHQWSDFHNTYQIRRRTLFSYDQYGRVLTETLQWHDTLTGLFHNSDMITIEWDQSNNIIEEIRLFYNDSVPGWGPLTKQEFAWDQNKNMIQEIQSAFNLFSPGWNPQWKYEFDFDALENPAATRVLYFNDSLQQWDFLSADSLFYDNSWTNADMILPYFAEMNAPEYYRHKLDSVVGYQVHGLLWDHYKLNRNYYSLHQPIGVPQYHPLQHKVYPNPARDMVHIELSETEGRHRIGLYDLTGRQILQQEFCRHVSLSVGDLSPGVYIYRISGANGSVQSGRLVVGL
jgi:hypothetical protein